MEAGRESFGILPGNFSSTGGTKGRRCGAGPSPPGLAASTPPVHVGRVAAFDHAYNIPFFTAPSRSPLRLAEAHETGIVAFGLRASEWRELLMRSRAAWWMNASAVDECLCVEIACGTESSRGG